VAPLVAIVLVIVGGILRYRVHAKVTGVRTLATVR
jgi:hypothetical protein